MVEPIIVDQSRTLNKRPVFSRFSMVGCPYCWVAFTLLGWRDVLRCVDTYGRLN
jgi:hypothetical protein